MYVLYETAVARKADVANLW